MKQHRIEYVRGPQHGETTTHRDRMPKVLKVPLMPKVEALVSIEEALNPKPLNLEYGTYEEVATRGDYFEFWSIYEWQGTPAERRERLARQKYGDMLKALDDLQAYASGTHLERHNAYALGQLRDLVRTALADEVIR